jgi:hypothetical protein
VLEEVGDFSDFRIVICKCGPFFTVFVFLVVWLLADGVTLYLVFEIIYQFIGEVVVVCSSLNTFQFICLSFFSEW